VHAQAPVAQQDEAALVQQLKQSCSGMAAAVLPFASTTMVKASSSTQAEIYFGLAKAVDVRPSCTYCVGLACSTLAGGRWLRPAAGTR
jgi:hypothetical protein